MKEQRSMTASYKADDLLTLRDVAAMTGYTYGHMVSLFSHASDNFNPLFRSLAIETDPSWRKAFNSKAMHVFRYGEVKRWFDQHQSRKTVQTYNRTHGVTVK
jgi:hypothetical protein